MSRPSRKIGLMSQKEPCASKKQPRRPADSQDPTDSGSPQAKPDLGGERISVTGRDDGVNPVFLLHCRRLNIITNLVYTYKGCAWVPANRSSKAKQRQNQYLQVHNRTKVK